MKWIWSQTAEGAARVRDDSGEENFIELLIFFDMVDVFEWLIYWHG